MDFFHFASTNAREEFKPRDIDDAEQRRIRERNDEIFTRAIRACWTRGMRDPLHGWREERDR